MGIKIDYRNAEALAEVFNKISDRKVGRWTDLCAEVKKTGKAANVTGITRGQAWSLKRTAIAAGLRAKVLDKGSRVIVMPAE